ncbi:AbiTii domain-containing protein [Flavobacterium mesophilum]|uniref:AbiTii domain-containing protein n=1 Tax=Flavobacterium mesophilum TaxID=3143495 RepID=UPI0031D5D89C
MKELLRKLLNNEGKVSLLLLEALELVETSGDKDLVNYIENELNGYKSRELPNYRKIKGEIIADIQNPYGRLEKNIPINIGKLSEEIGLDVTVVQVYDGIGFVEENLNHLSSSNVNRPLPEPLVESLNQIVQYNNPGVTVISAAHRFSKTGLQHIPIKVREELIKGLQNINKRSKENTELVKKIEVEGDKKIKVFVTYAWEDNNYNDKIISFVDFLRKKGFDATMDRAATQNETATNLNKMMVTGINQADKVIVVLSAKYKKKADVFEGGVGTEFQIILEELKTKINKFIFVSFGDEEFEKIVPTGIIGREILDLKKDQDDNDFNLLFSKILSRNVIQFSDVEENIPEVKTREIKPFRL